MAFVALEELENLHDGYRQVFVVGDKQILLIQEKNKHYILQAECPHAKWSLQNSPILDQTITCTQHGWAFNLVTGKPANERAGNCQLKVYTVEYKNNVVGLLLDSLTIA